MRIIKKIHREVRLWSLDEGRELLDPDNPIADPIRIKSQSISHHYSTSHNLGWRWRQKGISVEGKIDKTSDDVILRTGTQIHYLVPSLECYQGSTITLHTNWIQWNLAIRTKLATREKSFCRTSFQVGMDLKGTETRHEMKEREKTTLHLPKNTQQM